MSTPRDTWESYRLLGTVVSRVGVVLIGLDATMPSGKLGIGDDVATARWFVGAALAPPRVGPRP